jgi:hypothetical protein
MSAKSFQDILNEKMEAEPKGQISASAEHFQMGDPAGLSFLLGQVGKFHFQKSVQYQRPAVFSRGTKTHSTEPLGSSQPSSEEAAPPVFQPSPPPPPVKKRTPLPAHKLSDRQLQAFEYFLDTSWPLAKDFTAEELKSAFRQLALRTHPDRGGTQQLFVELKKNYDILKSIFRRNT